MSVKTTTRALLATATLALAVGAAAGCSGSSDKSPAAAANLPAAQTLLDQSATAMGTVQSVQFDLGVNGSLPQLPVTSANGTLKHDGSAQGSAKISELGETIQVNFILIGQTFYLSTGSGGYTSMPLSAATQVFDPSTILDPNKGIPKILSTTTNAKTVGEDTINGSKAYKIQATVDQAAVNSLIPGATKGTSGDIWVDEATHRVDKAVFTVPQPGNSATVTLTLTNYDKPVTIHAP